MTPTKPDFEPCTPHCPHGDCANCVGAALFPRSCDDSPYGRDARKAQAHATLDRVKRGADVHELAIDAALRATGDLTDAPATTRAHLGAAA